MTLILDRSYNGELNKWDITAEGEVDISTASLLREYLDSAFRETKADIRLHIDGLTYIDSTGLGVLIGSFGRMQKSDNRITLINPRPNIKKLLSITSLDKILY